MSHGLNAAPSFIIAKVLDDTGSWYCYHRSLGGSNSQDKYIALNDTNAAGTLADAWGTSAPNSTTFSDRQLGWSDGKDVIAYCFAPVEGYSSFGKYDGNGSSNGPFVYTGFRPRWIMHKRHDAGGANVGDWRIWDTARDIDNAAESILFPNGSGAEATHSAHGLDILSNGFKFKTSDSNINGNGGTFLYIAFAENPLKYARAR